jgi:hypothetical protein
VTAWRTRASAALCCAATALPGLLAAQAVPAQAELHLLAADASDGRALWVNPAGLARRVEASVGVFLLADDSSGAGWRLAQGGLQLATRGVAFGWQRDGFRGDRSGTTYVLGAGFGDARLALGAARRWYRRAAGNDGAWDVGLHAAVGPAIDVAAVWRDIGSPHAGDSVLEETLVAGAGVNALGRVRLSGEWHAATSGFVGRKVRAALTLALGRGLAVSATTDFSSTPRLRGTTVAVQLGRRTARFALAGREPGGQDGVRQLGAGALSIAPEPTRRFGRR